MDFFISTGETGGTVEENFPGDFFADPETTDIAESFFIETGCKIPFDVETVLPNWLIEEHEAGNTNLVKFFQHYYNWLYCTNKSDLYTDNIRYLQDIDNMNELTKSAFISSFVPEIREGFVEIPEVKTFLTNFKRDIIAKKGTEQGIALFFTKLFPEIVGVYITRIQESSTSLERRIILFYTGTPNSAAFYKEMFEDFAKPLGIYFDIELSEFVNGSDENNSVTGEDEAIEERLAGNTGFDGATAVAFEVPLIGNYYVYNMGDTGTILYSSGCSGSGHSRAIAGNTSDMPTHTHPNSIIGPQGASFGNINIYEYIYMPYTTANQGITPC